MEQYLKLRPLEWALLDMHTDTKYIYKFCKLFLNQEKLNCFNFFSKLVWKLNFTKLFNNGTFKIYKLDASLVMWNFWFALLSHNYRPILFFSFNLFLVNCWKLEWNKLIYAINWGYRYFIFTCLFSTGSGRWGVYQVFGSNFGRVILLSLRENQTQHF